MNKEIKILLLAVNSTIGIFKYPIGNKELTEKLKSYEAQGKIKFNDKTMQWGKI